jgi:hypothetical protein
LIADPFGHIVLLPCIISSSKRNLFLKVVGEIPCEGAYYHKHFPELPKSSSQDIENIDGRESYAGNSF